MPIRQIEAERNALKAYGQKYGKMPETPEEWSQLHVIAYPKMVDLPAEFKNSSTESLYASGSGSPTPAPTSIEGLRGAVDTAGSRVTELGKGNSALRVLQEAIGKKAGFKNTKTGTSEIFKQAGVGGMGALNASLQARSNEIDGNFTNYRNMITDMTGQFKEMADLAMFNYNRSADEYNTERARLDKIDADLRDQEQSIEMLNLQDKFTKENIRLRNSLSGSGDDDDSETTFFQETMEKSAELLAKLRDDGKLTDTNYRAEVDALMATFEWEDERRGEMESAINDMMSGNNVVAEMNSEDVANDWLDSVLNTNFDEEGQFQELIPGTGSSDKDFIDALLRRDKEEEKVEDKHTVTRGG